MRRVLRSYGSATATPAIRLHAVPAPTTITTPDRLALVTVTIKGTPYVIVDICRRAVQGPRLPGDYIISRGADGKFFTKTQRVHMCGNSVRPPPMATLARANDPRR